MSATLPYAEWFQQITGVGAPHPWQAQLASQQRCEHLLIRVPTGLGKTAGTALAWLYHRVVCSNPDWPRRLVFILPMRVLVEQVERTLRGWIDQAGVDVDVHVLMGGVRAEPWVLYPETAAVLVGTQDMLLSRALNRGFGASRGRWPQDFALLHNDALWVLDEVQLMDVSLMTSVQLAVFRDHDAAQVPWAKPARCWWMSATLQPAWLVSADSQALVDDMDERMVTVPAPHRHGGPWTVRKVPERRADIVTPEAMADLVGERHQPGTLSVVIVNRVERALKLWAALAARYGEGKGKARQLRADVPDLRLIHSRFRGAERETWAAEFLHRDAALPPNGRIIVSTQVIEAGVDISARLLITELAPWSSLIQRAGRAGRYQGDSGAAVIVTGAVPGPKGAALPYDVDALAAAAQAWERLIEDQGDASLAALTSFDEALSPAERQALYPNQLEQVLQRADIDELFDTTPDLTGADIDVSGFIRTGDARDVTILWRQLPAKMPDGSRLQRKDVGAVHRRELCPVPIGLARPWLGKLSGAYVWDYLDRCWLRLDRDTRQRLAPGAMVLVASQHGGYDTERGWDDKRHSEVAEARPVAADDSGAPDRAAAVEVGFADAAASQEDDSLSHTPDASAAGAYKTIATHGRETADRLQELGATLGLNAQYCQWLALAGRWHDAGKGHPVFQAAIAEEARAQCPEVGQRRDLAKAPTGAWRRPAYPERPGFRHELASTLALFELLRRTNPEHPALLGGCRSMLEATGIAIVPLDSDPVAAADHALAAEIAALDADAFDLVAYLVCAHHGKVRCAWTVTPLDQKRVDQKRDDQKRDDQKRDDQKRADKRGDQSIFGILEGDTLDGLQLCDRDGALCQLPTLELALDAAELGLNGRYGASWTERVIGLRNRLGPFVLAYLEALVRAADAQASQLLSADTLLSNALEEQRAAEDTPL